MSSIFSKILKGEIPGEIVYEDDNFFAILDISPVNKGHVLVIPKEEYKDITEVPDDLIGDYFNVAKKIGNAFLKMGSDGFNILMNTKKAAGQVVFHAHIHVIPRFDGDGLNHWPSKKYDAGEDKIYGEKIRSLL
ncbi:MAG: HIT family protein [Candidatus Woesearchaeota archaeon]